MDRVLLDLDNYETDGEPIVLDCPESYQMKGTPSVSVKSYRRESTILP